MSDIAGYEAKKILVTGGSGFIGSALCEYLYKAGAEVHSVSRCLRVSPSGGITWWQLDLADSESVRALFSQLKPDIVFHLASEVVGSRDLDLVLPTFNGNLLSAVNVLVASSENDCHRIVMAGSLEEPDIQDGAAIPSSPYAAAKWASSGYARMFHALYNTPVVLARLFMVYGPGQKDLKKLVPYVILSLLKKESPQIASGTRLVDWVYVDDVVRGLLHLGIASDVDGGTVDIGSGDMVTTRTIVEMLADIVDVGIQPQFGALSDRPMEQIKVANTARTYEQLGWKPEKSLRQGLEATALWYREQFEAGYIK